MGASYVNITVKGPDQAEIAAFLHESGKSAWVTPTVDRISVVYDSKLLAGCDFDIAKALAALLSHRFRCVTMLAYVFQSDLFVYVLYDAGQELDWYDSCPDYGEDIEKVPPAGGDAAKLCLAFGLDVPRRLVPDLPVVAVDRILRRCDLQSECDSFAPISRGFVYEDGRHRALLTALGLPEFVANSGYEMFGFGEYPNGLSADVMMRVGNTGETLHITPTHHPSK